MVVRHIEKEMWNFRSKENQSNALQDYCSIVINLTATKVKMLNER